MNNSGMSVIGTPEQAIAQIQRLIDQSGGFGTFLFMAHEWADRERTLRSYELFAREVMPHFQGQTRARRRLTRLGGQQPPRVHRRRHHRRHEGVPATTTPRKKPATKAKNGKKTNGAKKPTKNKAAAKK